MVTDEDIDRRISDKDAPRSARRAAAAKRIANLAQLHAQLTAQINDIEREIGAALADSQDVIDVNELHEFTDIPTADLTRWSTARTTARNARPKRKPRAAGTLGTESDPNQTHPVTAESSTAAQPTRSNSNNLRPPRVPAEV